MKRRDFLELLTFASCGLISRGIGKSASSNIPTGKSIQSDFSWDGDPDIQRARILTPRQFGAVGDGIRDDTLALRRMLAHPVNNDFVAYDFGSQSYRIATPQGKDHPTIPIRGLGDSILQIGVEKSAKRYKKMWLLGGGGGGGGSDDSDNRLDHHSARIVTDEKLGHPMLAVVLRGQSLSISGLSFQREERCTIDDKHFYGGPGVWISPDSAETKISEILFSNCHFSNCHRAVGISGYYYPKVLVNNGTKYQTKDARNINLVHYKNCDFQYPYGSNSTNPSGGDVATFQGNVIDLTKYTNCTFDGCVGGDCSVSPNRLSKDGCVFNSSYRLILEGKNHFKHGAVEMVFHFPETGAFLINTEGVATPIPRAGESVTIKTFDNFFDLGIKPGQRFYYESSGSWFYFVVENVLTSQSMIIKNDGTGRPCAPGAIFHNTFATYADALLDSRSCHIDGLRVSGKMINYGENPEGVYQVATPAIRVDDAKALIKNCVLNASIAMKSRLNELNHPTKVKQEKSDHVFKGTISNCTFKLIDPTRKGKVEYTGKCSGAIESYDYDGLTISNCTFHAPNSSCVGFVDLWSLKNVITNCIFHVEELTDPMAIKGDKNSFGVRIGNVGTAIAQKDAPLIEYCTFQNIQKAITTTTGQSNRASLGPGPSYQDTNTYHNVPQPYSKSVYEKDHLIGWEDDMR